jgi:hypothetical protein
MTINLICIVTPGCYTAHTGVPCYTMQLILSIFYMHSFTSLTFIIMLSTTFFTNARVQVQQKLCFSESCKYACFGTQNRHANMIKLMASIMWVKTHLGRLNPLRIPPTHSSSPNLWEILPLVLHSLKQTLDSKTGVVGCLAKRPSPEQPWTSVRPVRFKQNLI